jgi:hypothetical protein
LPERVTRLTRRSDVGWAKAHADRWHTFNKLDRVRRAHAKNPEIGPRGHGGRIRAVIPGLAIQVGLTDLDAGARNP